MLRAFLEAAGKVKKPYAIGGALAMAAAGYVRQTSDVDAFVLDRDRHAWIRALREAGLDVEPVFMGHHYVAWHPDNPRVRVDLLVPAEQLQVDVVKRPEVASVGGIQFRAFGPATMAAVKFLASEDVPGYLGDFHAMMERGLFDPQLVRQLVARVEPGELPRYDREVSRRRRTRR